MMKNMFRPYRSGDVGPVHSGFPAGQRLLFGPGDHLQGWEGAPGPHRVIHDEVAHRPPTPGQEPQDMQDHEDRSFRPSPAEWGSAVVCAGLALTTLLLLPLLETADTEIPGGTFPSGGYELWGVAVVLVGQAVALLRARTAPRAVLLIVVALPIALAAFVPGSAFSLCTLAIFCAVFLTVGVLPVRRLGPLLALTVLLLAGAQTVNDFRTGMPASEAGISAALQALVVVGAPALFALVFSSRREARLSRTHEVQALAREHQARIEAAVARERTAMSRELHDIAAHHMSGIALMTSAIQQQIDTDPEEAKRSAQQVRSQSTAVLQDLRLLVGLLREHPEGTRSTRTVAAVPDLVEERRGTGMDVEVLLSAAGDDREPGTGIGPLAQLVVYRMVQESLANASAHAPGARCVVEIDDTDPGRLTAVVRNGPSAAGPRGTAGGFGLLGLGERAELIGATLSHGPMGDGGWSVRLVVPREARDPDVDDHETHQELP